MALSLIAALVFCIGISLGISGYGGFLIPAILASVSHLGARDAVAHGLISFIVPGIVGAVLYWRRERKPSWFVAGWLCVGTVPGVFAGRMLSGVLDQRLLGLILAVVVLLAGIGLLAQRRLRRTQPPRESRSPAVSATVVGGAGLFGGAAAVLTGVGGPLITVPLLTAFGYEVTTLIGAAILNSVLVSVLAASSLLSIVTIDPVLLLIISAVQVVGVAIGVRLQPKVGAGRLTVFIAVASIVVGIGLIVRTFAFGG